MSAKTYRRIKGKNYDGQLLEAAEKSVAGQGDGRISERDAQGLLNLVQDQNSYTEIEKRTVQYIRDHFKFTKEGDALFRTTIRSWAAKRGAASNKNSGKKSAAKKSASDAALSSAQSAAQSAQVHGDRSLMKIPVFVFTAVVLLIFFLMYLIYGPGSSFTRFSRPLPVDTTTATDSVSGVETGTPAADSPVDGNTNAQDFNARSIQNLRIRFSKKTVSFDAAMTADLDGVVKYLNNNARANLQIIGHTCNIGQPDDNQRLSLERAEAVRLYFVEHGVDASRVSAIGRGETEPIASNSSDAGRIRNRRVEFRISE